MTDDILHTMDFVERHEYINEDYPEVLENYTAATKLPVPDPDDVVSFGWHELDGERVDEIPIEANRGADTDAGYGRSDTYQVVDVDHHYHHSQQRSSPRSLATNRIEITTTVIVTLYEET